MFTKALRASQVSAIALHDADDRTSWRRPFQVDGNESNSSDSDSSEENWSRAHQSRVPLLNHSALSIAIFTFVDYVVRTPLRLFSLQGKPRRADTVKCAVFHVGCFFQHKKQDVDFYTSLFSTTGFHIALQNWPWSRNDQQFPVYWPCGPVASRVVSDFHPGE